ncbi:unnamed protein product [Owenia fusiformis]|uniref:Uncharacterized protein n=1 Tax=Owenia fusiformis TaxID=6347 RepID=A0A8S4PUI2_OWEFU|nr:unnamed protein product [Owenia fusiformis]
MGKDGIYSIHIVDGCINKTSGFIKRMLPWFQFHTVPWMENESIQLLGCSDAPLHSMEGQSANGGMHKHFVTKSDGTIGGLVALVDPKNKAPNELYVLTANHMVEKYNTNVEYMSWSKEDQSDKHVIGTEVPYKIPLRTDNDDENNKDVENGDVEDKKDNEFNDWKDDVNVSQDAFDEQMIRKCIYHYTMKDEDMDEKQEEQYDIACIKVDDQYKPASINAINQNEYVSKKVDKGPDTIKLQYNACSECCINLDNPSNTVPNNLYNLVGSKVVKLGSSLKQGSGNILSGYAAGEIKVGKKTAWVTNMVVIGADIADHDTDYAQLPGDCGTIVCGTEKGKDHYPNCWMIFAGWDNANIENTWNKQASLAFSLPNALKELNEQVKANKRFKLSCCEKVFEKRDG